MNCIPRFVINNMPDGDHLHVICEIHGYVADARNDRYSSGSAPFVYLLDCWGKHVLNPMRLKEMVTEPGVIVQSDDMQYLPDHLK